MYCNYSWVTSVVSVCVLAVGYSPVALGQAKSTIPAQSKAASKSGSVNLQDIVGVWSPADSFYRPSDDARFTDVIMIAPNGSTIEGLFLRSRSFPFSQTASDFTDKGERISAPTIPAFLNQLSELIYSVGDKPAALRLENGKLVAPGLEGILDASPNEREDVVFKRDGSIKPSFNCARARQSREQAICASPFLSLLDQALSAAFSAAKKCKGTGLDAAQNKWFVDVLQKCVDGSCVPAIYQSRINELYALCGR